jgi:hypothetical protein
VNRDRPKCRNGMVLAGLGWDLGWDSTRLL